MSLAVYPIFLLLADRRVVVVGGGSVAERKVASLLEAGARVLVVAPAVTVRLDELAREGAVARRAGSFRPDDVDGAWLVVACTDDGAVQAAVAEACEARRVFCVAVDDLANASAIGGSVVRRPPFTIAISSSAEAPALTRLVREVLEAALPPGRYVEAARALRRAWKERGTPMDERFAELLRALSRDAAGGGGPT